MTGVARSVVVLLACALASIAFVPTGGRASVPSPIPAQNPAPTLTGIALASAAGAHPNADGLFKDLLVVANLTGYGTGFVHVVASLEPANGSTVIASNDTWAPFNPSGTFTTLPSYVALSGPLIRLSGINGPYTLSLAAEAYSSDWRYAFSPVSTTVPDLPLLPSQFAPPPANVTGSVTSTPVDPDHDGLYDALVVHVPLLVAEPGPVSVGAFLTIGGVGVAGSTDNRARFLPVGSYIWDLAIDGIPIRESAASGAWDLTLYVGFPNLGPGYMGPLIQRTVLLPTVPTTEFAPASASFAGPVTASLATSAAGQANGLEVVHVPLHVRLPGDYQVAAVFPAPLFGPLPRVAWYSPPTTFATRDLNLPAGDTVVDLSFSSLFLTRLRPGENFTLYVKVQRIGGAAWDAEARIWTETNVTASSLPQRPVALVNVTATQSNLACGGMAVAADRANGFVTGAWAYPFPGAALRLTLYPGAFELYLAGCGSPVLETLTVTGSENLTVALPQAPTLPPTAYVMDFPSWNASVVTMRSSDMVTPGVRFLADLAGNWDGYADATELTRYIQACCTWTFVPAVVTLDGSDDSPVAATVTGVAGAGPAASQDPVTVTVRYDAPLAVPPRPGPDHRIALGLYPASGGNPVSIQVNLPLGATGNASASAVAWYASNLTAPANVSTVRLGAGSWLLTPGGAPAGYPGAWPTVTIDATGGAPTSAASDATWIPILLTAAVGIVVLVAVVAVLRRPPGRYRH